MLGVQLLHPLLCQGQIAWGLPAHPPSGTAARQASLKTPANDKAGSLFRARFKDSVENCKWSWVDDGTDVTAACGKLRPHDCEFQGRMGYKVSKNKKAKLLLESCGH